MTLEFRLLGAVQVLDGSTVVDLAGERQRRILALLLLHPRRMVSVAEVIAAAWDESPPPTARRQVHTSLWRLRRILTQHGGARLLLSEAGGYRLDVEPSQVDLSGFESLVAEGRRLGAAGQVAEAAEALRAAVALWRGPALAGLHSTVLERESVRLEELRLTAIEDKIEYELALNDNPDLVAELTRLNAEHPLRERLAGALMLALYRADRQAEALQVYQRIAAALAEELGVDPGRNLTERHAAILRRSPDLEKGPPPQPTPGARPAQLPMEVRGFVGRDRELAELDRLQGLVVLSAISGTAGVGKTALAVTWAHRAVSAFPDGQLYVDLRGYHPDQPVQPADALAGFLRALGATDVSPDVAEQAALYRTMLAGRRILIVLDNAATAEQVRPLLPGTPSCLVVVTSRDSLAGLVARDGATRIDLDRLPPDEAVALLRALIGGRVDAEPAAAAVLAAQCAWLPLALRVAAELVSARPGAPLSAFTDELTERHRRLDWMDAGGDPYTAVRAVLSWSYQHLAPAERRAFRLLGLHPGADVDVRAAAALTGDAVEEHLNTLVRGHLLHSTAAGRFGMHDLLRAYAIELTSEHDDLETRSAALTRLFDYYTETAVTATEQMELVWLDAERPNLVATCAYAARHGWPGHAVRLAEAAWRYLDRGGHHGDALSVHSNAQQAAREAGDPAGEATATTNLGLAHWRRGDNERAIESFTHSLALSERHGDVFNQARALTNLGIVEAGLGRDDQAAARLRQAIVCFDKLGNAVGTAGAHNNLGIIYLRQQRYPEAAVHFTETLEHSLAGGDRIGEAHARTNLGLVLAGQRRFAEAAEQHRLALQHSRSTGDRVGEAHALHNLGEVLASAGRYGEAIDHQQQALAHFRATRDQGREAETLNALGETLRAAGRPEQAATQHAAALTLALKTADPLELARAHAGLGRAYRVSGTRHQAHHHLQQALTVYESLGLPQADDVRALLVADKR